MTKPEAMYTSRELMAKAGISRATLNNYIALGILPKPLVSKSARNGRSIPRIGHFPASALSIIDQVNDLKHRGVKMSDIVLAVSERHDAQGAEPLALNPSAKKADSASASTAGVSSSALGGALQLTLDRIEGPAYLVNPRFELEWYNDAARTALFGEHIDLPSDIAERKLFNLFLESAMLPHADGFEELLRFHAAIAKRRLTRAGLFDVEALDSGAVHPDLLFRLYDDIDKEESRDTRHLQVNLAPRGTPERWYEVHASFFREGVFFAFSPVASTTTMVELLARRDVVIRELLKRRRPYLTDLVVLVADLQSSMQICAELPPEEYFQLINDIWQAMEPKLRKYFATHGKHVGDGLVCYFFPQPDSDYLMNAINCSLEMKEVMLEVSRKWRNKKNWLNELKLNIGMHEGQEWFGSYQTPTHIEFNVLGDTINMAARLSDLARDGSIWLTKNLIGKLSRQARETVKYGVARRNLEGGDIFVPETFSRVTNLIDLNDVRYEKFKDIAVLPVAEVIDVRAPAEGDKWR